MKRVIPIILLAALVVSVVACQADPLQGATEEAMQKAANVPAEEIGAKTIAATVETSPVGEAEADELTAQNAAPPNAAAEPWEAEAPDFAPPKPVTLATDSEAVAFAMGDPDAPVQIVEFTDYECPFCQRYALETMPAIVENLVESGRVFYAIKDLPLEAIHQQASAASVAARCAGEQDAYLPMHDAIFAAQAEWRGTGDGSEAIFAELASELDLDAETFASCMADGEQEAQVQANVEEAASLGVNGTPFFFIDGYGVAGAQPYEMFEVAVQLAENGELDDVIEAQARQAYEAMLAQQAAAQQAAAQQTAAGQQAPPRPTAVVEVSLDSSYAIGDPDAPVTIVEYTDFQCPFCARHALGTFAQIEENLVDTGQVRYIFKDLPLTSIHPQAMLAAEAARCAGAQEVGTQDEGGEARLAMHESLFENQEEWSGRANAADLFAEYAAEIGLDGDSFATCLENHDFQAAVEADMQEAMGMGINGTPAFVINGHPISGALPYEVFEQAVTALLADAAGQSVGN